MLTITNKQARQFILAKQGLIGKYRFVGKDGAYAYIRQAGCIQFDPVDVCGKNAELTLQSRVKGFQKSMLQELLYEDRKLVDYPDKELSIWPAEDWPYFSSYRERSRRSGDTFEGLRELEKRLSATSMKMARYPVIPFQSREKSSGIPRCIGAGTGTKNQQPQGPFLNSYIPMAC